ncbi:hypothetical protein Pla52n_27350 [Stieleria varia]|uniref:Uncharacterized protein n=1 Tax=Stieleria varia TaxID=2528005 RepID=A0A5C6AXR0_9BACT|nr:hypothetical protein Pla52n_27350 [Stieleria varia]
MPVMQMTCRGVFRGWEMFVIGSLVVRLVNRNTSEPPPNAN